MKIAIIRYNAGNTASVANALRRLGVEPVISDESEVLANADKLIFPGVGEASTAMAYLRERGLDKAIKLLRQPVLGICLGMHLLCESSEENETECLGILPYRVRKFEADGLKVPHVGWNEITELRSSIFKGIDNSSHQYFVHGYFVENGPATSAVCDYGTRFSAAVEQGNFYAVQFHPEKSGETGSRILENFLDL